MKRPNKGKSLIELPENFTLIDIETTGLSPYWDEIIEIGAIKCVNCAPVSTYTTLIKPHTPIDEFTEELTGITNEMLENERDISEILPEFIEFIGSDILIAHNAHFDINFLYDAFEKIDISFSSNFVDTLKLSRLARKDEEHHTLEDLCKRYNIVNEESHRSMSDCYATLDCYKHLKNDIIEKYGSIEVLAQSTKRRKSSYTLSKSANIHTNNTDFDETHPLFKRVCVFTGVLEKMARKDAMQIVADLGGINADRVTQKTNFLILGNNDYCKAIKDGKSSKQKKAEKLKLSGQDIEIIPENVFYDMIDE